MAPLWFHSSVTPEALLLFVSLQLILQPLQQRPDEVGNSELSAAKMKKMKVLNWNPLWS